MHKDCFNCDKKQVEKLSQILKLSINQELELKVMVGDYLSKCDMTKTNPQVMGEIWSMLMKKLNMDNPYGEIKEYYNKLLMDMIPELRKMIKESSKPLDTALKLSITGNLIDFGAKHEFNGDILRDMLMKIDTTVLAIDDSLEMLEKIKNARTLLYLGDNCGEIVLDKLFIEEIKKANKDILVYYGVRGKSIVNDVTIEDAEKVSMKEIARVISNGDGSMGTVLNKTSPEFRQIFSKTDIVIAKGQGNYESLFGEERDNMFFMFMAKCQLMAEPLNIDTMRIVCIKNKKMVV